MQKCKPIFFQIFSALGQEWILVADEKNIRALDLAKGWDFSNVTARQRKIIGLGAEEDFIAIAEETSGMTTALRRAQNYFDLGINIENKDKPRIGTELQQKVWAAISAIPLGQTMSYKEIAEKLGRPRAFRAVANACGANPWPILIPCHRVVAHDGKLGGFGLGLPLKRQLLAHEERALTRKQMKKAA